MFKQKHIHFREMKSNHSTFDQPSMLLDMFSWDYHNPFFPIEIGHQLTMPEISSFHE